MKDRKRGKAKLTEYEKRKDELAREWGDHYSRWGQLYWQIEVSDGKYVAVLRRERQRHLEEMERISAEERELDRLEKEKNVKST